MKEKISKKAGEEKVAQKTFHLPNNKKAFLAAAVIIVIAALAWQRFSAGNQKPQYQTEKAQKGTIVQTVSSSGTVLTSNLVPITTSATGVVKNIFVKEGETVSQGQKIAEITLDQPGQAKNEQALSSYLSAKTNLNAANSSAFSLRSTKDTAWKKFYDIATSSQFQNSDGSARIDNRNASAEFQSAEGDWLAAEAKYKDQQAVISQTQTAVQSAWISYEESSPFVYAPIAGKVANLTSVPGIVLAQQSTTTNNSNQRIAVIQNDGSPAITVNLTEIDVAKVKVGQKATIKFDSIADKTFTGKVVTVDKIGTVSNNVTNYPAIIQFDTYADNVLPNMASTANVIIDSRDNVVFVPSSAIQNQNGQSVVRVLKNGQAVPVDVETGLNSDSQTEITSGLSEGDEVITGTITSSTQTQQRTTSPFGRTQGAGGFGGLRTGGDGGH